jgi:hypothetical protein
MMKRSQKQRTKKMRQMVKVNQKTIQMKRSQKQKNNRRLQKVKVDRK